MDPNGRDAATVTLDHSIASSTTSSVKDRPPFIQSSLASWLLCWAALLLCLAVAQPFVRSAFNDDWAYTYVAKHMAETGSLRYPGWGSPPIVFQSIWAALFIHLFGFSFNVVRLASVPFALGFIAVTHSLLLTCGIRRRWALMGGLTLAVSPLIVSMAASFMTDVYAAFFGTLCLLAALRCWKTSGERGELWWLWILVIAGILGGSSRQTVWIGPVILTPFLVWSRRDNRRFLSHGLASYVLTWTALVFLVLFASPKYPGIMLGPREWLYLLWSNGSMAIHLLFGLMLVLGTLCLPVLMALLTTARGMGLRGILFVFGLTLFLFDYCRSGLGFYTSQVGLFPFLGNLMTTRGVLADMTNLGNRPEFLHYLPRCFMTLLLLYLLVTLGCLAWRMRQNRTGLERGQWILIGLYTLPYVALLLPGALTKYFYDRYSLPLLPVALILTLSIVQRFSVQVPGRAIAALLGMGAYATALTHDYARVLEARVTAAEQAAARGISPLRISAGLERDGWLQVTTANSIQTLNYFRPAPSDYNQLWFWFYTPVIQPEWAAVQARDGSNVCKHALVQVPYLNWAPLSNEAVCVVRPAEIPRSTR